jgi:hypothetical protein
VINPFNLITVKKNNKIKDGCYIKEKYLLAVE